jgi:AcrR family transcriptional regulator
MASEPQPSSPPEAGPRFLRVLPKGRNAATREVVWESQHLRLLEAMASVVAEQGYGDTAVADVIARAGVSRKTFYEHFANKQDCFLAAYDAGVDTLLAAIDEAVTEAAPDWLGAARAGLGTYLSVMAENPDFARTYLIEVMAAGPAAVERRAAVHERFAAQLAREHAAALRDLPDLPAPDPYVYRACVGAFNELVVAHVREHGPERLPELLPQLLDVQLSLLTGHEVTPESLTG